ncbi:hypothetical protein [Heyndrickxia oleronia]|uniref:hypothetical protein n=1 Tax=Heyndrickxia oleronia TaxID=38875 RepID=UPI001C0E99EA|nr:hypothetical protein [Heyndrickxia oleronia]MBU5210598.1 hypothetical protein [Heyndrickxia oleronia]
MAKPTMEEEKRKMDYEVLKCNFGIRDKISETVSFFHCQMILNVDYLEEIGNCEEMIDRVF